MIANFYTDYHPGVLPVADTKETISQLFESLDTYKMSNQREVCTIFLVRHGESTANELGINAGQLDIPMTEKGKIQARDAAKVLASKVDAFSAAYCSPLIRTHQTYEAMAEICDLPKPMVHAGIIERCCGSLEGASKEKYEPLKVKERNEVAALQTFKEKFSYKMVNEEKYESYADTWKRGVPALCEIAKKHLGHSILIVGHVGFQRALMVGSAAAKPNPVALDYRAFDIPNGCIMVIESDGTGITFKATSPLKYA